MNSKQCLILICFAFAACSNGQTSRTTSQHLLNAETTIAGINQFKTIDAIPTPPGYKRLHCDTGSFGFFLQRIVLKKIRQFTCIMASPNPINPHNLQCLIFPPAIRTFNNVPMQ